MSCDLTVAANPLDTFAASLARILVGVAILVGGSSLLVEGAVTIARTLGVSELVIGLTIVAAGTSLPEVAASVAAALRGEMEIAIGNLVGSNIYNILSVLGIASIVFPMRVNPEIFAVALPVMVGAAAMFLFFICTTQRLERWEGACLLLSYLTYNTYLVLAAVKTSHLPFFETDLLFGFIPAMAAAVMVSLLSGIRSRR